MAISATRVSYLSQTKYLCESGVCNVPGFVLLPCKSQATQSLEDCVPLVGWHLPQAGDGLVHQYELCNR